MVVVATACADEFPKSGVVTPCEIKTSPSLVDMKGVPTDSPTKVPETITVQHDCEQAIPIDPFERNPSGSATMGEAPLPEVLEPGETATYNYLEVTVFQPEGFSIECHFKDYHDDPNVKAGTLTVIGFGE